MTPAAAESTPVKGTKEKGRIPTKEVRIGRRLFKRAHDGPTQGSKGNGKRQKPAKTNHLSDSDVFENKKTAESVPDAGKTPTRQAAAEAPLIDATQESNGSVVAPLSVQRSASAVISDGLGRQDSLPLEIVTPPPSKRPRSINIASPEQSAPAPKLALEKIISEKSANSKEQAVVSASKESTGAAEPAPLPTAPALHVPPCSTVEQPALEHLTAAQRVVHDFATKTGQDTGLVRLTITSVALQLSSYDYQVFLYSPGGASALMSQNAGVEARSVDCRAGRTCMLGFCPCSWSI